MASGTTATPAGRDPGLAEVVVAQGALVSPLQVAGDRVLSRCPTGHRRGQGAFEAAIGEDGGLVLRCVQCELRSAELAVALFEPDRYLAERRAASMEEDEDDRAEIAGCPAGPPRTPVQPPSTDEEVRDALARHEEVRSWSRHGERAPAEAEPAGLPAGPPSILPAGYPETVRGDEDEAGSGPVMVEGWGPEVAEAGAIDAAIGRFPIRDIGKWRYHWAVRDLLHASASRNPFMRGLLACPPTGAWNGVADDMRTCDMPNICPWCAGRHALDLYPRLLDGPCRPSAEGVGQLVLLVFRIRGRRLPFMEGSSVAAAFRPGRRCRVWHGPDPGGPRPVSSAVIGAEPCGCSPTRWA